MVPIDGDMKMERNIIDDIRAVVVLACRYWPNAGGDETKRENIRRAFKIIRHWINNGHTIQTAIGRVEDSAYRHANM